MLSGQEANPLSLSETLAVPCYGFDHAQEQARRIVVL
jgi:hypothetical protein